MTRSTTVATCWLVGASWSRRRRNTSGPMRADAASWEVMPERISALGEEVDRRAQHHRPGAGNSRVQSGAGLFGHLTWQQWLRGDEAIGAVGG